jgi:D-alanyl-D-alanine dipeptidase
MLFILKLENFWKGMEMKFRFLIITLILTISTYAKLPEGFVYLNETDPTIIIEMRYFSNNNFLGTKVDGYKTNKCIVTNKAAQALKLVQKDLLTYRFTLKVFDCYRPQKAVNHFVRWAQNIGDTSMKKFYYPDIDKRNLFKDGYIAEKSGHSRGSTVDLTIVPLFIKNDPNFNIMQETDMINFDDMSLDFGTRFDYFSPSSATKYKDLSYKRMANRALLCTIMEKYGFRNYDKEWWHYTLINEPFPDTFFDFDIE